MYYIQLLINGLSTGALYATIGVGFALIFSVLKFSNFSHGGTMVSCAYIAFMITQRISRNIWVTLLLTAVIGGILNLVIELVCFHQLRKSKKQVVLYFVSSITMGMLLENIIASNVSTFYAFPNFFTNRFLNFSELTIDIADVIMLIIAAVSISLLAYLLRKTRLGVSLRALSMDAETTSLMGVNVNRIVLVTFFAAGVFAAIAGIFVGMRTVLSPQLGSTYLLKGFIVSIIGGLGSISGALLGALILGMVETFLTTYIGAGLAPVGLFLFTMIFLALRPQGIAGVFAVEKA